MLRRHRIEEHRLSGRTPRPWRTRLQISSCRRVDVGGQPLLSDGVLFRQYSAADALEGAVVVPAEKAASAGLEGSESGGKVRPCLRGAGDMDDGLQDLPFYRSNVPVLHRPGPAATDTEAGALSELGNISASAQRQSLPKPTDIRSRLSPTQPARERSRHGPAFHWLAGAHGHFSEAGTRPGTGVSSN